MVTQEHCARLLTHHPGAAGPGEVWVTTRVVPAKTAARVPGPGSSPRAAAAPLLGCDLVFTARSPWLVGLRRWGSQAETLLGLPPWEGEGVETDRTQLGLLPAWSPPPPRSHSGLVCAAAGLQGPVFGPWLAPAWAGASSHTCVGAGGPGWGQPRARRSWTISLPSWASVSLSVKEYEDLPVQE